jgi:hypothetical protein
VGGVGGGGLGLGARGSWLVVGLRVPGGFGDVRSADIVAVEANPIRRVL